MSDRIRAVRNEELEAGPRTAGMVRSTAFTGDGAWIGEARTAPGQTSGWHQHGEHTTYGFVVSGKIHFDFGPGGAESVDVGQGDFFLVPAHTVHRESNASTEEQVVVIVRLGAGPTVINVEEPDR